MKFFPLLTFISLALSLLTPGLVSAQVARMGIEQLPPTFVVEETSQELTAHGCQAQAFTNETKAFLVNPEMPYPVIPSTVAAAVTDGRGTIFFCSKQIVESLTVQGKVSFIGIGRIAKAAARGAAPVVGALGNTLSKTVGTILTIVMTLVANALTISMSLAAMGATYFLDYGEYLSNPIVQTGWPFVLGFANLGFVLALLFIALATVLRLESFSARRLLPRLLIAALMINFSLIIAVFIIDASRLVMTVIAQGLASDSRCTGTAIACLPANILAKSQLVQTVFSVHGDSLLAVSPAILDENSRTSSVPFPGFLDTLQAMFMIVLMTLAFVVLMILLLIRWLALVVLLVLSPLAYLFVALPGTGKWARMWWDNFIKYVLYGPVIVLVLSLFARAQEPLYKALQENFKSLNVGKPGITQIALGDTTAGIFMTALSAAFLFGAAMAGEKLGVIGGQMATTRFKQGVRMGYHGAAATPYLGVPLRAPQFISGLAQGLAARSQKKLTKAKDIGFELMAPKRTKYLTPEEEAKEAERFAIQRANQAGFTKTQYEDFDKDPEGDLKKRAIRKGNWYEGDPWDPRLAELPAAGRPGIPGVPPRGQQQQSGAAQTGQQPAPAVQAAPTGPVPRATAEMVASAQIARQELASGAVTIDEALQRPILSSQNLRNTTIKTALGPAALTQIVQSTTDLNQIMAVIQDVNYLRGQNDQVLSQLGRALYTNPNLTSDQQSTMADTFIATRNQARGEQTA